MKSPLRNKVLLGAAAGLLLVFCGMVRAEEAAASPPAAEPPPAVAAGMRARPRHGLGHKLLLYLPNRLLDLADIVRFRLRLGLGLAADARLTIYAANFIGQYDAVYAGFPGPRRQPVLPRPAGREALKGLMVMGVDATDKTPHPPRYTDSEMTLGVQALVVGLDAGLDPIEIGDFLAGWALIDIAGDDL